MTDNTFLQIRPAAINDTNKSDPTVPSPAALITAGYATIIDNNTALNNGGGVSVNKDSKFDVTALMAVAHGNRAEFDSEVSVPLRSIGVVGNKSISGLASR